jgi:hypothetical protein
LLEFNPIGCTPSYFATACLRKTNDGDRVG